VGCRRNPNTINKKMGEARTKGAARMEDETSGNGRESSKPCKRRKRSIVRFWRGTQGQIRGGLN
jgi:hypothetical protein